MDAAWRMWELPLVQRLVTLSVALGGLLLVTRLLQRSLGRYVKDGEARYRARKVVGTVGLIVAVLVIASSFSAQLGGLTIAIGAIGAIGAASAGIAFALQEVIASVAGWLAISFGAFYRVGDRVQLGGIEGDVIDIGVLRTTLMEIGQWVDGDLYNGRIVRIANSFVFKEPVFNYSSDFPFVWDEIKVPIKYGTDWRRARALLEAAVADVAGGYVATARETWGAMVKKFMIEDARVDPMVTMTSNDNWIEFTVRYVVDCKARRTIKDRLFTRIIERIDETGGGVGLASATFHLVELPRLDVRLVDGGRGP